MENTKRHIVLGSEGFIGKYLVNYLKNQDQQVVGWDIKNGVAQDCSTANLSLNKEDVVYFLAWDVGGAKYLYREDTQLKQLNLNLKLMKNVFDQLERSKCSFIFISSQLASTDSVYGTMKRLGELWTSQIGGCCLRLWNVYGAYEDFSDRSHVISDFIHQAQDYGKIEVITTGDERRQFIHIRDVCDAIKLVLKNGDKNIYDITSFGWVDIKYAAKLIADFMSVSVFLGNKKGSTQDVTIKGQLPNWSPNISLEDGIKETISLFRKVRLHGF